MPKYLIVLRPVIPFSEYPVLITSHNSCLIVLELLLSIPRDYELDGVCFSSGEQPSTSVNDCQSAKKSGRADYSVPRWMSGDAIDQDSRSGAGKVEDSSAL